MSRSCALLLVLVGACTRQVLPITASQVAERHSGAGRMLLAYLGQRDASAAVCDLNARGPHLNAIDATVRGELTQGLREGRLAPALWSQCVEHLVRSADPRSASLLLDEVAYSYGQVVIDTRVENDPAMQQQLDAVQSLLVSDAGDWAHSNSAAKLLTNLRDATAQKRLGPIAQRSAASVIADLELANGMRDGQRIDGAVLDELLRQRDESMLARYTLRLPDSSLRFEARRRLIRLRVERSPLPAVRDNAVAVEETLMRLGVNPIDLASHRPLRATIDESATPRRVVVRQDVEHRTTSLVGTVDDQPDVSVLPELSLRRMLRVELDGIDGQVRLCDPPESLNPAPCVSESAVSLDNRLAYLERDGTVRFVENLPVRDALALAARAENVVVPIAISGRQVAALELGLRFETPNDLVFYGGGIGGNGPYLRVRVEPLAAKRLSYTVANGKREYVVVVEGDHASEFHVVTQGGEGERGRDGAAGSDGFAGLAGANASCPSSQGGSGERGQDGGAGENGGAGGDGGNGGDSDLEVATPTTPPSDLIALLRTVVLSRGGGGGSGGSGGNGGHGGAGGPGGAGTTCVDADGHTTFLSAGSQGFSGSDGRSGFNGMSGSSGGPGQITVKTVPPR